MPSIALGPSASVNLYSLDPHQRTSYTIQESASLERELGHNAVIELGYTGTLGIKLQQNVQVSNTLPGPTAASTRKPYSGAVFAPGTVFPSYITVTGKSVGGGMIALLPNEAQSNYYAMYIRAERRFANGFSYLSSRFRRRLRTLRDSATRAAPRALAGAEQLRLAGGLRTGVL